MKMATKEKVEIFDTTLRDGEQSLSEGWVKGIDSKLEIAYALQAANVDTLEVGFPGASPQIAESVHQIAKSIRGPYIAALSHLDERAMSTAWDAIKENPNPTLHIFSKMASDKDLVAYGITDRRGFIENAVAGARRARKLADHGRVEYSTQNFIRAIATALHKNDKGMLEFHRELHERIIAEGVDVINMPDTEGWARPEDVHLAINWFNRYVMGSEGVIKSFHAHNDGGLATANALKSVQSCSVRQLEGCFTGIGERAGNLALEEAVWNIVLHGDQMGVYTDIRTAEVGKVARIITLNAGKEMLEHKPVIGTNAWRHSSGIHQDGKLKGDKNGVMVYELQRASDWGWSGESLTLTAQSGKHAVHDHLVRLGYDLTVDEVHEKFMPGYFTPFADQVRKVTDLDLRLLMEEMQTPPRLIEYVAHGIEKSINREGYTASVKLRVYDGDAIIEGVVPKGRHRAAIESEDVTKIGPIDALLSAIDQLVEQKTGHRLPPLLLYDPHNIGKGHSTKGQVTIVTGKGLVDDRPWEKDVSISQPLYFGRATGEDTLEAAARSYVNAANQYLLKHMAQKPAGKS